MRKAYRKVLLIALVFGIVLSSTYMGGSQSLLDYADNNGALLPTYPKVIYGLSEKTNTTIGQSALGLSEDIDTSLGHSQKAPLGLSLTTRALTRSFKTVYTLKEFKDAIQDGVSNIYLGNDIVVTERIRVSQDHVIDGRGYKLIFQGSDGVHGPTGSAKIGLHFVASDKTVMMRNMDIDCYNYYGPVSDYRFSTSEPIAYRSTVIYENVKIRASQLFYLVYDGTGIIRGNANTPGDKYTSSTVDITAISGPYNADPAQELGEMGSLILGGNVTISKKEQGAVTSNLTPVLIAGRQKPGSGSRLLKFIVESDSKVDIYNDHEGCYFSSFDENANEMHIDIQPSTDLNNPTQVYIHSEKGWNLSQSGRNLNSLTVGTGSQLILHSGYGGKTPYNNYHPLVISGANAKLDIQKDGVFVISHATFPAASSLFDVKGTIRIDEPLLAHFGGNTASNGAVLDIRSYASNAWYVSDISAQDAQKEDLFVTKKPSAFAYQHDVGPISDHGVLIGGKVGALTFGKAPLKIDDSFSVYEQNITGITHKRIAPKYDYVEVKAIPFGETVQKKYDGDRVTIDDVTNTFSIDISKEGQTGPTLEPGQTIDVTGMSTIVSKDTVNLSYLAQQYYGIYRTQQSYIDDAKPIITKESSLDFGIHTIPWSPTTYPLSKPVIIDVEDARPLGETWTISLLAEDLTYVDPNDSTKVLATIDASCLEFRQQGVNKGTLDQNPEVATGDSRVAGGINWLAGDEDNGVVLNLKKIPVVGNYKGYVKWTISGDMP